MNYIHSNTPDNKNPFPQSVFFVGQITTKDYSLELHNTNIPQRVGGTGVHNSSNLTIVDLWQHEAIDPYRHVGADKISVKKDVDIW